jgi:ketosteroid isomerase-like protein
VKKLLVAVFACSLCAGLALAQADKAADKSAAAKGPSVSQAIKDLEQAWGDSVKSGDMQKLGEILADDWKGIGPDGKVLNKKQYMEVMGKTKTESFELGPIDVKTVGATAIAQGSETEKSTTDGKDSSGKFVWMDVFAKRDGKWVAVRSQTAKASK